MSDVPGEILLEILSRLPVVPLLRFRCVSKQWKYLIDSNEFIRHHLNHSLKNPNSNLTIILDSRRLYSADFDLLNVTNRPHFHGLDYPLKIKLGNIKVLGSCHGLLVLSGYYYPMTTILWNPSIRRFHELPYESIESLGINHVLYGFGYDVVSDDYKLIRMVHVYGDADIVVKVYSLKSDSWRRIPDLPDYYLKYGSGEFANGGLHWNVGRKVDSDPATLAIAFNLGTEDFNLVPLPEFAVNHHDGSVFVLEGCLGLMFNVNDNVNIWVMKEYGVVESWSFLFTFNLKDEFRSMIPMAYSNCNRKVVLIGLDDAFFTWYDLDTRSIQRLVQMPVDMSGMHTCMQSLVLLNSGTRDFDLKLISKDKKGKPKRSLCFLKFCSLLGGFDFFVYCLLSLSVSCRNDSRLKD